MSNSTIKRAPRPSRIVLALALMITAAEAVPSLSDIEAGNVTTTSFCVCWETSESSIPGLEVFSDLAGTQSLAGEVAVALFPLESDRRSVESTVAIRQAGRDLRSEMQSKNVVLVKVSGLDPGTDYFARPVALDGGGATIASGDMQAVTTSQTASFVNEARRVVVDLTALDGPGTEVAGGIVVITAAEARYPLLSVVGDASPATKAYADLTQFLTVAGDTNLLPTGVMEITINWKGIPDTPGSFTGNQINYGTEPVVAESSEVPFTPDTGEDINYFVIFRHFPPVAGLPQDILVAAQDPTGAIPPDYDRPAIVASTPLVQGAGATASFVDGILAEHTITFGSAGTFDFTVRDSVGASESTLQVEVLPLTYDNWRVFYFGNLVNPAGDPDADPEGDGLKNAGEFTTLRNPLLRDASVLNVASAPGGIKAWLDFNRFQTEYVVTFETSLNLQNWVGSSILPTVQQSLPDRDIIEAIFPPAEFNNAPFGGVRAVFGPAPPP